MKLSFELLILLQGKGKMTDPHISMEFLHCSQCSLIVFLWAQTLPPPTVKYLSHGKKALQKIAAIKISHRIN